VCLVMKIYLCFMTNIPDTEPKVRVQDPLGSQTLMKSNSQLRFEGQGKRPQPPVQIDQHTATSSSQTTPPHPSIDDAFSQIMDALGSLQREVSTIGEQVERCQIGIKVCLKYHEPHNPDDD
jgi:hypothetical protein